MFKTSNSNNKLSDPYVKINFNDYGINKTKTISKTTNPIWNDIFEYKNVWINKYNKGGFLFYIKDEDGII